MFESKDDITKLMHDFIKLRNDIYKLIWVIEEVEKETFPSPDVYDKNSAVVKEFASKIMKLMSMMEHTAANIKSDSERIKKEIAAKGYTLMKEHDDRLERELKEFFDKYDYMIKRILKKAA
jgi:hypothetical protein